LFGEVSKLIFSLLSDFFALAAVQKLLCACVVIYQSFGQFARFHPHWHVLVLEGGFSKYDRFVYLPIGTEDGMCKVWQSAILSLLLLKGLIDKARVNMLKIGSILALVLTAKQGYSAKLIEKPLGSM